MGKGKMQDSWPMPGSLDPPMQQKGSMVPPPPTGCLGGKAPQSFGVPAPRLPMDGGKSWAPDGGKGCWGNNGGKHWSQDKGKGCWGGDMGKGKMQDSWPMPGSLDPTLPMPQKGSVVPPPPMGKAPQNFGGLGHRMPMSTLPPGPVMPPMPMSQALAVPGHGPPPSAQAADAEEKKHRIVLLLTKLSPDAHEDHIQQLLEQCGEVQIFRRGRGPSGQDLSFGIVQYGDPEAAWKASVCINKLAICGQEVKVLVEEHAELLIKQWRERQKALLKLHSDEELEFELERKTVSCKVLLDAKFEELYGSIPAPEGGGVHSSAERRKELKEREAARVAKAQKRKKWREEEYAKELEVVQAEAQKRKKWREEEELEVVQAEEKRRRLIEGDVDEHELKDEFDAGFPQVIDMHEVTRMVDRVQAETFEKLFALSLDMGFLREDGVLERKLRPWLERKIDLHMGGPQSDLVEHVLRRVNDATPPDTITTELARYIEDSADPVVERMWRMMVFELVRAGRLELDPPPREERRTGWEDA